jgi:hypothetical protein
MNYEPNKIDWKVGDLVIHDADSKAEFMLMKVVKIIPAEKVVPKSEEPIYITEYIYPNLAEHGFFENTKAFLHDPTIFHIRREEKANGIITRNLSEKFLR